MGLMQRSTEEEDNAKEASGSGPANSLLANVEDLQGDRHVLANDDVTGDCLVRKEVGLGGHGGEGESCKKALHHRGEHNEPL